MNCKTDVGSHNAVLMDDGPWCYSCTSDRDTILFENLIAELVEFLHDRRDKANEQYQNSDAPSREEGLALGRYRAYVNVLEFLIEHEVEV